MSHTAGSPWIPSEVADTLACAAKHTGMRGEKLTVHWKDVAAELSAKGGGRTASAIASHFAGVDSAFCTPACPPALVVEPRHPLPPSPPPSPPPSVPSSIDAAPHARYGSDEDRVLLDLLNDPKFLCA